VLSLELLTGSSGLELPRVVKIRTQMGAEMGAEPSLVSGVGHWLWQPVLKAHPPTAFTAEPVRRRVAL